MSDELRKLIGPIVRPQTIMWSAIFMPTVIYGVLLYVIETRGIKIKADLPPAVLPALGAIAVLSVVAGVALHIFYSSEKRIAACVESFPDDEELARDPRTRRVSTERLALVRGLSRLEKGLLNYATKSRPFFVFAAPIVHTSAVVGFIMAVMTGRPLLYVPFALLAALPTLLIRPRVAGRIEEYARMQPLRPDDPADDARA